MKTSQPNIRFFIIAGIIALLSMVTLRLLGSCISFGIIGHWVSFRVFDPMQEIILPILSLFFGFLIGGATAGILESINSQRIELGSRKSYILITIGAIFCYIVLKNWFF